ncbi:serine/threonine-protein kinase [Persicimonas caeni]|nr:serine/threonine-protein kinase [Persicimonas caeni]
MAGRRDAYRLESKPLSTGGQAEIFRAEVKKTGEQVALKRFFRGASRERSRREIDVLQNFDHPNIIKVLDFDSDDYNWYVMPLADGSLAKIGPNLDPRYELVDLTQDLLDGLEAAHSVGVVHRDLNPRNILRFTEDAGPRWVVADWGLVRRPLGQTTVQETKPNGTFGTEGFSAPESYKDAHNLDQRADIYALGRVIAWALTAEWPVPNIAVEVTGPWQEFVSQTTALAREERPATVEEVRGLLRLVQQKLDEPRESSSTQWEQVEWDDAWIPSAEVHLRPDAWEVLEEVAGSICKRFECEKSTLFPYARLAPGGAVHLLLQRAETQTYEGVEFTAGEWFRVAEGALSPLGPQVLFELGNLLGEERVDCIFRQRVKEIPAKAGVLDGWSIIVGAFSKSNEGAVRTLFRCLTLSEAKQVNHWCSQNGIRLPIDDIRNFSMNEEAVELDID